MPTVVKIKVVEVDSLDRSVGVNIGDVFDAYLAFNNGTHYYIIDAPKKSGHHLLKHQVESVHKENNK